MSRMREVDAGTSFPRMSSHILPTDVCRKSRPVVSSAGHYVRRVIARRTSGRSVRLKVHMLLAMSVALASELPMTLGSVAQGRDRAAASLRFLAGLEASDVVVPGSGLVLRTVVVGGSSISLRPLNPALLIEDADEYLAAASEFERIVTELATQREPMTEARVEAIRATNLISHVLYTTLQSQGFAMDCLLPANQARKNFGMRFEELIEHLLASLGIGCKPVTFGLKYETAAGAEAKFSNQVDLVIAEGLVGSAANQLKPSEVVVSLKTSSKDRFAKIFLDQEMLRFVTKKLFHNPVG
jgi:hypothetical protein